MIEPRRGGGSIQWNGGGWFGAQIGGTLWMLLLGVLAFAADWRAGGVALAAFVVANTVGVGLYRRRGSIAPIVAVQVLLVVVGLCGLAALAAVDRFGAMPEIGGGWGSPSRAAPSGARLYGWLLVIPGVMLLLAARDRIGGRR